MNKNIQFTSVPVSDYVKSLSNEDAVFYIEKLTVNDVVLPDPYGLTKSYWTNNVNEWPDISYPDIYQYFVETSCFYSRAEVKNVKSLDGYQYFVLGHVQPVSFYDPGIQNYVYLMAEVLPSQRQSNKKDYYKTYIISHKNGEILKAHCTCMAGAGKACSHAAALAYKIDALRRLKEEESACTSFLCSWNDMSKKKATPATLKDIDFQRPKYGQALSIPQGPAKQRARQSKSTLTETDVETLRQISPDAALFTCIDVKKQVQLPLTPYEIFSDLEGLEYIDYIEAMKCSLNTESIKRLADMTVKQSRCKLWKKHRKGRITGSKMHSVYTLRDKTSRDNIVKSILGLSPDVKTPAMLYGINNEESARRTYTKYQREFHDNFQCKLTGLILNENYPYLGSSPDGLIECSCCGKGCLEIKCLAKYKDGLPGPILPDDSQSQDQTSDGLFFTTEDRSYPVDENFQLKKSHQYYTQVQGHMLITELEYCDLYLWSKSRSITVRVFRDNTFIHQLCEKLRKEYLTHVVPKLLTNNN